MLEIVCVEESRLPTFVLAILTFGNTHEIGLAEIMFFAEFFDTLNNALSTIRCNDNKGFHLEFMRSATLGATLPADGMTNPGDTYFLPGFWAMVFTLHRGNILRHFTDFSKFLFFYGFGSMFSPYAGSRFADLRIPNFISRLRADRMAKLSNAHLFDSFGSVLQSGKTRTGDRSKIKAMFAKWFEFVEPELFAGSQHLWNKYQLDDLKNESISRVLAPCMLQFWIVMHAAIKFIAVTLPSIAQIIGTANVELTCNGASNAVNARCGRYVLRVHQPTPLVSTLFGALPGSQGHSSSDWEATPALDNTSIIPFFGGA